MHTTWLRNSLGLKHRLRQASETITSKAGDWILGFPEAGVKQALFGEGEGLVDDLLEFFGPRRERARAGRQ